MQIIGLVSLLFEALWILVFIYVLGSWIPSMRHNSFFRSLSGIVEPMLQPFRRILPPQNLGGLDLSPLFLMLALGLLQRLLIGALRGV